MQKHLVEQLSKTFPNMQFIVSTHSPLPLLGAPKDTMVYVVKRNREEGVVIQRMDNHVMFEQMLPNSILSSPIFGLDDLVSSAREDDPIYVEDDFSEVNFQVKLEKDIEDFLTNKKQEELINLYKSDNA
jgi:hypothetical protein